MPFSHTWFDDAKTVIYSKVTKPWTWEEYIVELKTLIQMMDEVDHGVICLGDHSAAGEPPAGAMSSLHAIADNIQHPNFVRTIIIGVKSDMGKTTIKVFRNMFGKLDYVDTLEDARSLIKRLQEQ